MPVQPLCSDKKIFLFLFLFISFSICVNSAFASQIEVSQQNYLTSNSRYDRNPSIVNYGSNYWLFYTKADTYNNRTQGNVDADTYVVYYKVAPTIEGLPFVPEIKLDLSESARPTNFDQRVVSAAVLGSDLYAFVSSGQSGTDRGLYYYKYTGGGWVGPGTLIADATARGGHVNVVSDGSVVYIVWESAADASSDFYRWDGTTLTSKIDISTDNQPKIARDGSGNLYVVSISDNNGNPIVFYKSTDSRNTWSFGTIVNGMEGFYDPSIGVHDGSLYIVSAPYDSVNDRQYLMISKSTDGLTGSSWTDKKYVTNGSYNLNYWWDYWPILYSNVTDLFMLFTTERNGAAMDDGEIAYYRIDWDVTNDHFEAIQIAVDAASTGDMINVAAGTYDEQVVITKSLTLRGAGDTTIIKPSSAAKLTSLYTLGTQTGALWNGMKLASIISVSNADNVIIQDLKVDGESLTSLPAGANYVVGISYGETGGTVSNAKVVNMNKIPESIRTYGMWLDAVSKSVSIEVKNSTVELYNKNGINARGATLTINIHNNSITGPDTASTQYPNGIGIVSGAMGTVAKNVVTYIQTPGEDYTATGIFTWDVSGISIEDNTITETLTGIALSGTPSTGGTTSSTVQRNIIFNCDVGIQLETPNTANNIITDNNIHDNDLAFYLNGINGDGTEYSIGAGNEAHYNKIYSNLQGIENNNPDIMFNATYNWWGSNTGPYHSTNPSGTGNEVSDNVLFIPWLNFTLTLTSPQNISYNYTKIPITASSSLVVDSVEYSLDGGSFRSLCTNCNYYNKSKTFPEESHNLVVRAILGSESVSKSASFFIDSKKPRIIRTLPKDGDILFSNSTNKTRFYIKYTENNLTSIILYLTGHPLQPLTGCPSGINKECTIDLDLSSDEGNSLDYYFEVKDSVNTVISDVNTIKIDNTVPIVTIVSPIDKIYDEGGIYLTVNVNEIVEKLGYYIDGSTFRRLCDDCNSYNVRKIFSYGNHTLLVKATDYAGNIGYDSIIFYVDNKKPKILDQSPDNKKYTNGTFIIKYTEENLQNITLFYKGISDLQYQNQTKNSAYCQPGTGKECNFWVNLTNYNGQKINYYFIIWNHVSSAIGKVFEETVDTAVPNITINYPTQGSILPSRRVPLNVSVTEKVKLEYSDNDGTFRLFCSNCDSYVNVKTFSTGMHNLTIRATDKANNVNMKSVQFTI
jgi:hypothetical protein